jgi:hypothetical protein
MKMMENGIGMLRIEDIYLEETMETTQLNEET